MHAMSASSFPSNRHPGSELPVRYRQERLQAARLTEILRVPARINVARASALLGQSERVLHALAACGVVECRGAPRRNDSKHSYGTYILALRQEKGFLQVIAQFSAVHSAVRHGRKAPSAWREITSPKFLRWNMMQALVLLLTGVPSKCQAGRSRSADKVQHRGKRRPKLEQ